MESPHVEIRTGKKLSCENWITVAYDIKSNLESYDRTLLTLFWLASLLTVSLPSRLLSWSAGLSDGIARATRQFPLGATVAMAKRI